MGLGILSDRYLGENVPGTSLLDDLHNRKLVDHPESALKRSKDGIILVPQPSSSPNDPLNWPFWRKCMLMLTLTYGAGVVGAFGPIIGAGLTQVATNLDTSVDALSMITGDLVLAIGLVLILTAPASVIWGRRPVFLIGNALLLASSIWSSVAKDLGSLTASRVIGGIGMAPIECLVEASIADIFFVHERGKWIAVWSCGILFILTILFVPETAYVRPVLSREPIPQEPSSPDHNKGGSLNIDVIDVDVEKSSKLAGSFSDTGTETVYPYLRTLLPYSRHRFSEGKFWKIALRPFTLVCSPAVAWGTLVYGTTSGWLVALSVSVSLLFSSPEYGYDFRAGPVGLISGVGPFIAAILGNAIAGPLSDWSVTWLSRRNNGVYEPEFRLFMVIPLLLATTIGWVVSYVVDAHSNYAPEAFATINCIKNLFTFGLTYYVVPWLTAQGVLRTFCTIGGINIWVCLMTIPMYVYGKRARSWVHRTPWMLA
ncbi:hypothetical protein SERLADRAFT_438636 [Serpula lacrymans var. lacrymans S7.9]|uniref:Major facilitator superfamily (MFS) profile domain-containing protein n=1 Tax=Serpula lacrymans var. lacrymans (strain S7.9) TaxID=578457 RepID=F8NWK6_SERL9|nr:uncharacterized protein SERLADRAFT_438636 [Serpula lacrymans var. lacrymans S7.9]EGO25031.1 hypothetical protein SERLADRAFT_438636 [Serpula lacrymans var. lacrymans S7.9]